MTDLPLMTYVATMSVTPGPNNLMLAASGVNFGFRRTLPHLLGVCLGCSLQVLVVASLLAYVMVWLEAARIWLLLSGCSYLLWLAWRQAQAGQPGKRKVAQPLGFIGAALFQWVNPKAWKMALNSAIVFLPPNGGRNWIQHTTLTTGTGQPVPAAVRPTGSGRGRRRPSDRRHWPPRWPPHGSPLCCG